MLLNENLNVIAIIIIIILTTIKHVLKIRPVKGGWFWDSSINLCLLVVKTWIRPLSWVGQAMIYSNKWVSTASVTVLQKSTTSFNTIFSPSLVLMTETIILGASLWRGETWKRLYSLKQTARNYGPWSNNPQVSEFWYQVILLTFPINSEVKPQT